MVPKLCSTYHWVRKIDYAPAKGDQIYLKVEENE
jgi:hypothetical protein